MGLDPTVAAWSDTLVSHDGAVPDGARESGERRWLPVGTVLEGVYEVKGRLGAGGMGMVYLVEHMGLGKEFALKMVDGTGGLDAAAIIRLRHEARLASAIEHENVVNITHIGKGTDGNVFIVMERLRGEDLGDRLARQRRAAADGSATPWLPDDEAATIVEGVLAGLAAAHAVGIVHRDLKPGNIVLASTRSGMRPKIVEFGIGKLRTAANNVSAPGAIVGTPRYMSPEQARSRDVDGRADIYSMGVVAYEMMCGRAPLEGMEFVEVIVRLTTENARDPRTYRPDLPASIAEHLLRALAIEPANRFQTVEEMHADWTRACLIARRADPSRTASSDAAARVLVVEDDAGIRANVLDLLEAEGFVGEGAATGEEGLRLAFEHPPDLVICDVTLPGIDGYEVVTVLTADPRTRHAAVIFLSGLTERAAVRRGMNLGADDYLTKPFARKSCSTRSDLVSPPARA